MDVLRGLQRQPSGVLKDLPDFMAVAEPQRGKN